MTRLFRWVAIAGLIAIVSAAGFAQYRNAAASAREAKVKAQLFAERDAIDRSSADQRKR